jgi:hypothetical protein
MDMIEGRLISSSTHRSAFFRLAEPYPCAHRERVPAPDERVERRSTKAKFFNQIFHNPLITPLIRHAAFKQRRKFPWILRFCPLTPLTERSRTEARSFVSRRGVIKLTGLTSRVRIQFERQWALLRTGIQLTPVYRYRAQKSLIC